MPKYSEEYIQRRKKWWMECNKYVTFADYGKAVSCAKSGIKLFPKDVVLIIIPAEAAFCLSPIVQIIAVVCWYQMF